MQLGSWSAKVLDELGPAVLLQATPLGSLHRDPDERPLPEYGFRPGCVALDMVYQPRWTRWLRDAAHAGAVPVPGAAMFLHQARAQVRLFTEREVDVETLRQALAGSAVGDAAALP